MAVSKPIQSVADILADTLRMFSLPLVKIVVSYYACAPAMKDGKPKLLFTFGGGDPSSTLPSPGKFSNTCVGIGCVPDGRIWAATNDKVHVFAYDGAFLFEAGKGFTWSCGVCCAPTGEAFIADAGTHNITVCGSAGQIIRRIGTMGTGDGEFNVPSFVTIDWPTRQLFVADLSNNRIQKLNLEGKFVASWGHSGKGNGCFSGPYGLAINSRREIGVVDRHSHRIQVFDLDGKFQRKFGEKGIGVGQLDMPYALAVDAADNWICADFWNHRVCVFSREGSFFTAFGNDTSLARTVPGQLNKPCGVCVDDGGRILVGDANLRIHVFGFETIVFGGV